MKTVDATPRASLLVNSMRDVGYSLPMALADIIDNSIAASANTVHILADPMARYIAVVDDGRGMDERELFEIMRPGSRGSTVGNDADLGRFGLGLKSASFSQCKRLTVVSRRAGALSAATWDLDYVVEQDKWLLQIPENVQELPGVSLLGRHGTVILWEVLDRIAASTTDDDGSQAYTQLIDEARENLELVFHRYLTGEKGADKVAIVLNNNPLQPYDPFHRAHRLTSDSPEETIGKGENAVQLQAFTLPHHKALKQAEWDFQGGSAGHLRSQGFYLYRQKRLIIHGTWFGLMKMGELTKLSRVRIDIGTNQDHDWKVDIKKASADPPASIKKRLRQLVETISVPSRRIYTGRAKRLAETSMLPVWVRLQGHDGISYLVNRQHPLVSRFAAVLDDTKQTQFEHILALVEAALPVDVLFADVSDDPIAMSGARVEHQALIFMATNTATQLLEAGMPSNEVRLAMKSSEPFRSKWDSISDLIASIPGMDNA